MGPKKTVLTYYATTFSYRLFTDSSFSCWILFLHLYHVFYFVKRVSDTKLDLHQDLRHDLHFRLITKLEDLETWGVSSEITSLLHSAFLAKSSLIILDKIKWHCSFSLISRNAISSKNRRQYIWYVKALVVK